MANDVTVGGGSESRPLTGLRGVAALLVMLHHFVLRLGLDRHLPPLEHLLRKGYLGVDLFFVLSGFVMTMTYGTWFSGRWPGGFVAYLRFMVRRVARLWPLHVTVLAALLGLDWAVAAPAVSPRMLVANVLMVQAWGFSAEINAPAWSISTEMVAYLLFPLLVAVVLRPGWRGPLLCLGAIAAAVAACQLLAPAIGPVRRGRLDIYFNYSLLPVLRCLAGFTFGMLAWRAGQWGPLRRVASHPGFGPAALALAIGMMAGRVNDLLIFLVMPVIVVGMHAGNGPLHRLLGRAPFHTLGLLSYAIYLIHFSALMNFPFQLGALRTMLPLYFAATIGAAAVCHLAVELPGRRLVRRVGEWGLRPLAALLHRPA